MTCARCATPTKCAIWGCVPGTFPSETTACASTAATTPVQPITAALILRQMEKLIANMPPEPFGEFMRSKGFPPETCTLALPESMRADVLFPPPYVRFSPSVQAPYMVRFRL